MLKLHFVQRICHNSDMFRSIFIISRVSLNISKAHIKHSCNIKYTKLCAQNVCRYYKNSFVVVQNWSIRCRGCGSISFCNGSYQEDTKYMFLQPTRCQCTDVKAISNIFHFTIHPQHGQHKNKTTKFQALSSLH